MFEWTYTPSVNYLLCVGVISRLITHKNAEVKKVSFIHVLQSKIRTASADCGRGFFIHKQIFCVVRATHNQMGSISLRDAYIMYIIFILKYTSMAS